MTKPTGKTRSTLAVVLAALLTGIGGFKAGDWYGSLDGPLTPEGAYKLLSAISSATDTAIIRQYRQDQAELAAEAQRRREALEHARRRREVTQKDVREAKRELARARDAVRSPEPRSATVEQELTVALAEPPQTEQAAEIQAKAARAVRLLQQKNEWLQGVVSAQAQVIERQELVIREFQSEVAEYERNLVLWKDRYEKAEGHIRKFGNRKTKIAVAVLGVAAGVYVGVKVF